MSNGIGVFWGCTIGQRIPFIESAIRRVFKELEIEIQDIEGVSCCPDPLYAKTLPHMSWLSIAARNLAIAAKDNKEFLVMCNGCYKVLKSAQLELQNPRVREEVNKNLKKFGLEYSKEAKPVHLIEYLNRLGVLKIKHYLKKRLAGLKTGVHYGCHILRPRSISVDSVTEPVIMETLLKTCGALVVNYGEKELCCGGTMAPFDAVSSEEMIRQKFASLKAAGIDCLVVTCPSCFIQYDVQARNLKKQERVPVFHIAELLALAFGVPAEDLNFNRHTTDVSPILEKLGITSRGEDLKKYFDIERLKACCGSCTFECNVAKSQPDNNDLRFDPQKIVKLITAGKIEEAIASPDIWKCLGCFDCTIFCPSNMGLGHVFETLRQLAVERGMTPEIAKSRIDLMAQTGREAKGSDLTRKKMGLPASSTINVEEIKVLLEVK